MTTRLRRAAARTGRAGVLAITIAAACDAPAPDAARDSTADTAAQANGAPTGTRDTGTTTAAGDTVVTIFFSRDDSIVPVTRTVSNTSLASALRALLHGPTAAERATGITSWFSDATAELLRSVGIDTAGTAVIDFGDLRPVIPNASSSAGSAMLLRELNATVFAQPDVTAVQYRIDGSCDLFWEWLQYGCQTVQRPAH